MEGAYKSVEHYLDVQFRLMREDFIQPLRNGIHEYLKQHKQGIHPKSLQDIRLYHDVHVLYPVCQHNGISYRIRFDISQVNLKKVQWASSKRLIYGSLVCLSKDDFQTMMFATVTNRAADSVSQGEIEVHFEHNAAKASAVSPEESFLMAESTAFFEAYRHVLSALKAMKEESFPFKSYIVDCIKEPNLPKYLEEHSEIDLSPLFDGETPTGSQDTSKAGGETNHLDQEKDSPDNPNENLHQARKTNEMSVVLNHIKVNSRSDWSNIELRLDASQLQALKVGLTQEFAIIQGPPGTGKTFLGLKIVKALLHNHHLWREPITGCREHNPILIVCYTNHALDQFLDGISQFHKDGLLRVGGRCKNENLKEYTMKELQSRMRKGYQTPAILRQLFYKTREWMEYLNNDISEIIAKIEVADKGILHENTLHQCKAMSQEHYEALRSIHAYGWQDQPGAHSYLLDWLGVSIFIFNEGTDYLSVEETEMDTTDGISEEGIETEEENQFIMEQRMTDEANDSDEVKYKEEWHQRIQREAAHHLAFQLDSLDYGSPDELWQITVSARKKNKFRLMQELRKSEEMAEREARQIRNFYTLTYPDRWRLYRFWLSKYKIQLRESIRESEHEYRIMAALLKRVRDAEDRYIMQRASVIGMTTTCAARYHHVLQQVGPKIVIVEEAAEVLEAHIVSTLSEGCQHLILIGDHQQLRPNPTVYDLAEKYSLKISLFERMINNGQNVVTLENQHRMRPDISSVMRHIYPKLKDHSSVLNYDQIRGVEANIFFIDHRQPEMGDEELKSKSNEFEAKYIAKLCKHFLNQDYEPSQITVLTPYTGQLLLLKRYMPKKVFEGVRVCAVDSYQGEENNIILISLVRSNSEGKLGFLAEDNRVCVLLSRAKMGLYVMGNFSMLAEKTTLWANVVHTLKQEQQIGSSLALQCSNHPTYRVDAKEANDFNKAPEGGCMVPCDFCLHCGHACVLPCHAYDKDHKKYECRKWCTKTICDRGHKCKKQCYERCGDCKVPVRRTIPSCGHDQDIPCYMETEHFSCKVSSTKMLPCGHDCQTICGNPTDNVKCKVKTVKQLQCGHKELLECYKDPQEQTCKVSCPSVFALWSSVFRKL